MTTRMGPHCPHHGDCMMDACSESGYAEYPCQQDGCPVCGGPSPYTVEAWGRDLARWLDMTPDEQARVRSYWETHPLVRRVDDPPTIPRVRLDAARHLNGGK